MKEYYLHQLINNPQEVDKRIMGLQERGVLQKQKCDVEEIKGHILKARHNLRFISENIKLGFYDWAITGCYYAPYHAALALILTEAEQLRLKPIIEFLMHQPQMQGGVLKYTGAWNLQAILIVKDTLDLRDFEEKFISQFGGHIHKYIIVQLAEQTYYPLFPAEIQQAVQEIVSK